MRRWIATLLILFLGWPAWGVVSRRRADSDLPGDCLDNDHLLLSLDFTGEGIWQEKVADGTGASFTRASDACEWWRQPARLIGGVDIPRFWRGKGIFIGPETQNVVVGNIGSDQQDIDLWWNNLNNGCLRAFNFEQNCDDETGTANATLLGVGAKYLDWSWVVGEYYYLELNDNTNRVNLGNAADIQNLTAFTISAWINADSDGGSNLGCIYNKHTATKARIFFRVQNESGGLVKLWGEVGCATDNAYKRSTLALSLGDRHHVAMTWDDATKTVKLYLDGSECSYDLTQTGVGAQGDDIPNNALIGNIPTYNWGFDGQIDIFRLYNRVLTADEIKWLAHAGDLVATRYWAQGTGDTEFWNPHLFCVDGDYLLIGDSANDRLMRYHKSDMSFYATYGSTGTGNGEFDYPNQVCVDGDYAYVAEQSNNRVQKLNHSDLSYHSKVGIHGSGDGQFQHCRGVIADPNRDRLYVSDYENDRIQVFKKSDLSFIEKKGTQGSGNDQLYRPIGLHYDEEEDWLLIVDGANFRIMIWDASDLSYVGKFGSLGSGNGQFYWPHGVCTDGTYIYVADSYNNRIQRFNKTTYAYVDQVGTIGVGTDQFWHPSGVEVEDGYLYVSEDLGARVQKRVASDMSFMDMAWDVLYLEGGSIKLEETGGSAQAFTQAQTLTQVPYIASTLIYTGSEVTSADAEMYASGEIISNGGFEVDLSGWTDGGLGGGTGSAVRDVGTTHGASAGSLKVTHSNAAGYYRALQNPLLLVPNRTYNISVWCYISSADVPSDYVRIWLGDFSNAGSVYAALGTTDAWQEVTIANFDPGADGLGYIHLAVNDAAGGGGAFVYFDDVSITETASNLSTTFEHVGGNVYMAWAIFTGGANAFDIGVQVEANKTVYVSLLSCYLASTATEGGSFPSGGVIPNDTLAPITVAAPSLTIAGAGNYGLDQGTIDMTIRMPCSEAEAATNFYLLDIYSASTNRLQIYLNASTDQVYCYHRGNSGTGVAIAGATSATRDDELCLRIIYGNPAPDGTNYLIGYYKVNGGDWTSLGVNATAITDLLAGCTINIGHGNGGANHVGSYVEWLRIYDQALEPPSW